MKQKQIIIYLCLIVSIITFQGCKNETDIILENTYPISSISPSDDNFADLIFLNNVLKNKQIVFLGEASHGDGATFQAKTRLVKFLHEELNYKVLAFEGATIFDMHYASAVIQQSDKPKTAELEFKKGLCNVWSYTNEFKAMADYVWNKKDSLNIIGIDNTFLNYYASFFPKFLDDAFDISSSTKFDFQRFLTQHNAIITNKFKAVQDSTFNFNHFTQDVNTIKKLIEASKKGSVEARTQIILELENLISYTYEMKAGLEASVPLRDERMAKNLSWYINNFFPNEKVIVWTANYHGATKIRDAIYEEGNDLYQGFTNFAEHVSNEFGNENVFSIAFTSSNGEYNAFSKIDSVSAPETSWEFKIAQEIESNYAFIDFSRIREAPVGDKEFESIILGHKPHFGKWYKIFDGVIYVRNMKPTTYKNTGNNKSYM
ncbi:erythromycin esterase family protein [Maribellus sp. CM-23]|uniref:erythromycin esterase family protein n=1 Tax=Maribellus sp. CM-23 TaxID=2781026 RepID=UPI001F222DC8|nr:erythromycin esterase family protein [Maribellus sp. CM-23]MCE4566149.1 erythromycin esterase family protein [Maribellus sp. CM-23]